MHITFTFCSQNCCLLLTPKHLHTVTHACTKHNWGVLHAVGFLWPCAQQCVEAPPPWHLARWQTNMTAAAAGGGEEEEGGRREAHWDTSSHSLYVASKRNCNGAARHTVLITLFLLRRRVFTCTYTQTHAGCFEYVCGKDRESTVYTPEYTVLEKQAHSWSPQSYSFSFLAECRNIKHIIPAFDHVTHWWYLTQCNRYILLQRVKHWAAVD